MRSATILNSVALAMVAGAGLVVGFSAYSSIIGQGKHKLDADIDAVLAGTDKPVSKSLDATNLESPTPTPMIPPKVEADAPEPSPSE